MADQILPALIAALFSLGFASVGFRVLKHGPEVDPMPRLPRVRRRSSIQETGHGG